MTEDSVNKSLYKMRVAYKGNNFHGFQSQNSKNSIQDHLEKLFLPS